MKSYPGSGRGVEYLVYYLVMKQGVGDEVCCENSEKLLFLIKKKETREKKI